MRAVGTRLARVVFVDQCDHDPFGCRFVLHVVADFAVVPAAHAAVLDCAAIDSIGDVSDVADGDRPGFSLDRGSDDRPADLVFHVPHDPAVLGLHARFGLHETPVAARPFLLARRCFLNLRQPLGVSLAFGPPLPAGDDGCDRFITHDCGMNLAQIHGYDVAARRRLGLLAVLHDDVPEVPSRFLS